MTRAASFTLALLTCLIGIGCGPRIAPRIEVPAEFVDSGQYREAYTAFWWNCAIVKSIDLAAACPKACTATPPEMAGCAAGATAAEAQIAELQEKEGPELTQEILSYRIGRDDGHALIAAYFPYGPRSDPARD